MKKLPFFFFLLSFFLLALSYPAFSFSGNVNVLLNAQCKTGNLSGSCMTVSDAAGKSNQVYGTAAAKASERGIIIGQNKYVMPVIVSSSTPIEWDGIKYYGDITFKKSPAAGCFAVGNSLDIEMYLRGVIRYEMDPKWNIETLKAQAVIARTYAAYTTEKHGEYNICATGHCQLYKGIKGESERVSEALKTTAGMILRWNGRPASVFYHSDSGGMVTGADCVWNSDIPYLKPRPDLVRSDGPNSEWQAAISTSYIESKLADNSMDVGKINSVKPLKRDKSGRVLILEIRGSAGTKKISGYKFRSIIGPEKIKSTLFEIGVRTLYVQQDEHSGSAKPAAYGRNLDSEQPKTNAGTGTLTSSDIPENKEDKLVWMAKNKIFTVQELMEMLSKPDKIDSYLEMGTARMEGRIPIPPEKEAADQKAEGMDFSSQETSLSPPPQLSMAAGTGPVIMFYGRGSGHGVGLSQYGAKALADKKGWNYIQILSYYFPGTILSQ